MKRVLIGLGVLLAVIVSVAAAIPFIITPDFVGQQMQAAVKKATGRTLVLGKAPTISYWPEFAVDLERAKLSNPPGMYEGQFARMERIRVRVGMRALLARKLDVREVTLVRPQLTLLVDRQGRANWDFSNGKPAARADSPPKGSNAQAPELDDVNVAPVVIEDGDVRFLDERNGTVFAVSKVNLNLFMANLDSPLEAKGSLIWKGQPISLSTLYVKAPTRLVGEGSPIDVAVTSPLVDFSFSGRAGFANGFGMAGKINTQTPSIRKLASWAGRPMAKGHGLEEFSARAGFDWTGNTLKFSKAIIALDGMNAQGSLSVVLGARPMVTANLGIDRLNVNAYLGSQGSGNSGSGSDGGALSEGWSNKPIDFSGLKALNASLALSTNRIEYGDMRIGSTAIAATLKNGVLDATLKKMAFYEGNAAGRIVLNGARKVPTLQGALSANNLDGYRLLKDFARFKRISGKTAITLSLAAAGRSQRELVSTLNGKSAFKFTNGAIRGINIAGMIRNVDKAILGGWEKVEAQDTDFSVLQASFDIKRGIATNSDLSMIGPLVRLTGAGTVDMPRQHLDYKVDPKVVASLEGQGGAKELQGVAVPVIIKGPWAKPQIYPDVDGILQNPQAAFDALARLTGGKKIDVKTVEKKAKKAINKIVEKNLGNALDKKTKSILETQGGSVLRSFLGNNN